ncbi:MAG: polyphosphate kinase 1 [Chitinophagaceae bacterium]|nr:polyphosphate kinase 1 [Chitinophagaceae bacterium]
MTKQQKKGLIIRDISWLSFNARVLQEANDPSVPLPERLRFLGIVSNNMDEFFRVRVATLTRMVQFGKQAKTFLEDKPADILKQIQAVVLEQQKEFDRCYQHILQEMRKEKIVLVNENNLSKAQKEFVTTYFTETVRTNIAPLMIESLHELPLLQDKSIYLACFLHNSNNSFMNSYALIEVPTNLLPRFVILPSNKGMTSIILLEDIIRYCLPSLFTQFGFDSFESYIIKVTRDAELDIDNDVTNDLISNLEKSLKKRKKGKAVRLVYDRAIQKNLLNYLVKLLNLTKKDHLIAGGRIHNFKDYMDFPFQVFKRKVSRQKPFVHPLFTQPVRILEVLNQRDVMLHFPYHSFDSIIDLLREAAIDPFVETIRITCYRLARHSKIVNALVNAVRNGKKVIVVIELRARFDEEANLKWKAILEEEGVKVFVGFPNMKIHAKICLISKRVGKSLKHYGFVSTGNLNESTARFYGDHCLMTSDRRITLDIQKVFDYIEHPADIKKLTLCKTLILSPVNTRQFFLHKIRNEVRLHTAGKPAACILKLNSLSDHQLIQAIYDAKDKNLSMDLIIRGICCAKTHFKQWENDLHAISIVDEYLEHARVLYFRNNGADDYYISSADWMMRNIDYRIEATVPVYDPFIKEELRDILSIQLSENVKARILDNHLSNIHVPRKKGEKIQRSQVEIYNYLMKKSYS